MINWTNALKTIGNVAAASAIDNLAACVKSELGFAGGRADSSGHFELAGEALDRVCRRSMRLSPTTWTGDYAHAGRATRIQVVLVGDAVIVIGDAIRVPLPSARENMALYLLLRNGGQALGAWLAREAGGQVDLSFMVRLSVHGADVDTFTSAIVAAGSETINLLLTFGD
jgi:hypothetical protein